MRNGRFAIRAAAVAAALLTLSSCAPEPEPEPELLTISQAGERYLEAVCPLNDAWDEVDVEVDRLRIAVNRGEDPDTVHFVQALTKVSEVNETAAVSLEDETIAWPDGALDAVSGVRESLERDAEQIEVVREMSAVELSTYSWQGAEESGQSAYEARVALELPESAETACAEWLKKHSRE